MGAFLEKPKTDKFNESGAGNGLKYGLSSMQGWRVEMEDAHTAAVNLQGELKDWAFFAVFDGHAGSTVSAHCSQHLLSFITSSEEFKQATSNPTLTTESIELISTAIRGGFLRLDETMRKMPQVLSGDDKSGTTAVCALIAPTHIFVANCGDSRAVLRRTEGVGFSTTDHKPINPLEKERIQNAGGSVMIQRVNGALAVSRALGDYEYKNVEGKGPCEQLVSPEPEIFVEERRDNDQFMVLACDGIWDVMSNDELCAFVQSRMLLSSDMEQIANSVVDTCFYKGSKDNMSLVLVAFPGAPPVSEEAIRREVEVEERIKKTVLDLCSSESNQTDMTGILCKLELENIPNLPPGGGLRAKRGFVESLVQIHRPEWLNNENDSDIPTEICDDPFSEPT